MAPFAAMNASSGDLGADLAPGEVIRALRKRRGLTLNDVAQRTGLAVSTISKLEKGQASLSYDKLVAFSKALGVDISELLEATPHVDSPGGSVGGRRIVHRAGEGQTVETRSYRQTYLATELLNKKLVPIVAELRARTLEEFSAEFGGLIRHPGEEFMMVLDGEIEFHTELYAPLRMNAGDSLYFDSTMGHAYLKASDSICRVLAVCSGRGAEERMLETFVTASKRQSDAAPLSAGQGSESPVAASHKKRSIRLPGSRS